MKRVSLFFATALTAFMFAACSNDDFADDPAHVPPSGENTYATFTFKMDGKVPNAATRAGMEQADPANDQGAITDLRLLIFGEDGKLVTNAVASTTAASTTVATTSGPKRIFVLTNTDTKPGLKAKLDALIEKTATLTQFYALMTDGQYTTGPDADMGDEFKELLTNNALVMSNIATESNCLRVLTAGISAEDSKSHANSADHNNFTFDVYRAVAKGNLTIKMRENSLTTTDGVFELSPNATFAVRNINRSTLFVQQYMREDIQVDPTTDFQNPSNSVVPHAAFYTVFDGKSNTFMENPDNYKPYYFSGYPVTGDEAQRVSMYTNAETSVASPTVFFSENTNSRQTIGNTTYFAIATRVNRIAAGNIAASISFDVNTGKFSTTAELQDYDNTAGTVDFYYIREIPPSMAGATAGVLRVFTNKDVAWQAVFLIMSHEIQITTPGVTSATELEAAYNNHVAGSGNPMLSATEAGLVDRYLGHYVGGVCYYRLNVYENTTDGNQRCLVRRNHNYNALVTSFKTIGSATEEDLNKNPDKPVNADVTNVTATISVAPWTEVNTSDDL